MANNKYKVVIVEDDVSIRGFMQTALEVNGYQVLTAGSGREAKILAASCPDIVILDLGLPDIDGQSLIKTIRETSVVPIIVVSARSDEPEKVKSLDLGANDYVTKPFGTNELLARVRAALRIKHYGAVSDKEYNGKYIVGELIIDYDYRRIFVSGNEVILTQTEYNILTFLSLNAGKILTYDKIVRAVWGTNEYGDTKKLQVNMANIRKKLGVKPGDSKYIRTEIGVGYMMLPDETKSDSDEKEES